MGDPATLETSADVWNPIMETNTACPLAEATDSPTGELESNIPLGWCKAGFQPETKHDPEKSLADGDLLTLWMALDESQSTGVHNSLAYNYSSMFSMENQFNMEERKLAVRTELHVAITSEDADRLRTAILDGRTAGIDEVLLDQALYKLKDITGNSDGVDTTLQLPGVDMNHAHPVSQDVDETARMHCGPKVISLLEQSEQPCVDARASDDVNYVQDALLESMHFIGKRDPINESLHVLAQDTQRGVDAQARLHGITKSMIEDPPGISEEEMQARGSTDAQREKDTATDKLRKAMECTGDSECELDALRRAIEEATRAGVSEEEVRNAVNTVSIKFHRVRCRIALETAMSSRDMMSLWSAIDGCRGFDVEADLIERATAVLDEEMDQAKKMAATAKLRAAMHSRDAESIGRAVRQGRDAGVDQGVLDDAIKAMASLS